MLMTIKSNFIRFSRSIERSKSLVRHICAKKKNLNVTSIVDLYLIKFQRHVTKYFCSVLQFTRITALTRAPFSALSAQEVQKNMTSSLKEMLTVILTNNLKKSMSIQTQLLTLCFFTVTGVSPEQLSHYRVKIR